MKILAVDDEPDILDILSIALPTMGTYEVETATSGAEAMRLIEDEDNHYDCFLLDIQMPKMNGVTLCNAIRKNPDYMRAPILMLTAMSQVRYVDQAFSVGATDYVTKPFDFKELRSRMAQARRLASKNAWVDESESSPGQYRDSLTSAKGDFTQPTAIADHKSVIGHGELENYITQITKVTNNKSWAIGVKLLCASNLFENLTLHEFKSRLSLVVDHLVTGLGNSSTLVSYRGNGVLLCVGHKKLKAPEQECARRVNAALAAGSDDGEPMSVLFSDHMPLNALTVAGNMRILLQAVEMVEVASDSKTKVMTVPRRLLGFRRRTTEEHHLERRAYQVILDDLLSDGLDGSEHRVVSDR